LPDQTGESWPEYRYHLLRVAAERFKADLSALDADQSAEAHRQARLTFDLECLVLSSPEAAGVAIAAERVAAAVAEVRGRYGDAESFASDLARNGLDPETLGRALCRELAFDAVMQQVAADGPEPTELEERLFYELHQDRFRVPERRAARHILITVNEDYAENRREAALARSERIAERLRESRGGPRAGQAQRFGALARKLSECPTALEDGRLGETVRGKLYPELDALLFRLREGEVGGPVESEMGFHLVLCERIRPARTLPFSRAQGQIRAVLVERCQRDAQKAWIARLRAHARGATGESTDAG
jgi:peptidyl-prolyl cis-trans isomerase C